MVAARLGERAGDRRQVTYCLALLAWAAAAAGDTKRAAWLWATVVAQEPAPGKFWRVISEEFADRIPSVEASTPGPSLDEAVEYALASID